MPLPLSRRGFALGALGTLGALPGCAWRGTSLAEDPGPMVLGWRLVPGQRLIYSYDVRYITDTNEVARAEQWTYLVLSQGVDGVSVLSATLTGYGVGMERGGDPVAPELLDGARGAELERLERPLELHLSMDGQLRAPSAERWSDRLTHRLLGLHLPERPLVVGERWSDLSAARIWTEPLPPELELQIEHQHTLAALEPEGGQLFARVETRGDVEVVPPEAGPIDRFDGIRIRGESRWDVAGGRLDARSLTVEVLGEYTGEPGLLTLRASLVH